MTKLHFCINGYPVACYTFHIVTQSAVDSIKNSLSKIHGVSASEVDAFVQDPRHEEIPAQPPIYNEEVEP